MNTFGYGSSTGGTGCCGSCCDSSFNKDAFDDEQSPVQDRQPQATSEMTIPAGAQAQNPGK